MSVCVQFSVVRVRLDDGWERREDRLNEISLVAFERVARWGCNTWIVWIWI
jgi:hypothetical protein